MSESAGVPTALVGSSGATNVGGGFLAILTDTNDASYAQLPTNGARVTVSRTFTVPDGIKITSIGARVRARRTSGPAADALEVGLILPGDSVTRVDSTPDLTGAFADYPSAFSQYLSRSVDYEPAGTSVVISASVIADTTDVEVAEVMAIRIIYALVAPTLSSPVGDVTGSITPTLTVVPNSTDATHHFYEVRRVSDNALMWASSGLAGNSTVYGGTTLVKGVDYKWRAKSAQGSGGTNDGEWSNYQNFRIRFSTPPVMSITGPSGSVGSLTPTISWSYSDADGNAQASYQLEVRRASDQVAFWASNVQAGAGTSVVYGSVGGAPTTLVAGTTYEVRGRVTDSTGEQSNFTGWTQFTPQIAPNAPTVTSPSGKTDTLTPTIQGSYNQGAGDVEDGFRYQIRQSGVTIYDSGPVTGAIATGQVYGTANSGDTPSTPPALAWGTAYEVRVLSIDDAAATSAYSAWIPFTTNIAPTTPSDLSPNGSIVGDTTPRLTWVHNDPDGDAQTSVQIEIRKVDDDSAVTGYDPKTIATADLHHDVTETLTNSPSTQYKWRIRTLGLSGAGYGPWSDWVTFTVADAMDITLTEPVAAQVLTAPALTSSWSVTGGSGTQQSYRIRIYESDATTLVYDSGVVAGTATTHVVPAGHLRNNGNYLHRLTVVDTNAVEADNGFVSFTTDWTPPATIVATVTAIGAIS